MSHVTIVGTIASEPKSFTFPETGKTKLELRVLDGGLHHTVIAWEKAVVEGLKQGDAVLCSDGRIGYRSYDKDVNGTAVKTWQTEITVQNITKLGSIVAAAPPVATATAPSAAGTDDLGF